MGPGEGSLEHKWHFSRAGGFDQVRIKSGADLSHLDQLDQKLWVALSCPTQHLEFDTRTLEILDTDKDGRIRPPEIIRAAKWACACLKNPDDLLKGLPSLPLDAINDATPEGQQIIASAKQILANLGKADASAIDVGDTSDTARIFAETAFNGDGIVPADAEEDESVRTVIEDIITCLGAETDRSGKPGVSQELVDRFFSDAQAYVDWGQEGETDGSIMPLGTGTPAAADAVRAVRAKVDDYFTRCRLAAFDSRAMAALNREEKEYLSLSARDLTISDAEIAGFPLARVEAEGPLPLREGVNPAWAEALERLEVQAVRPHLGEKTALTETEWKDLLATLAPYESWLSRKTGASVEKLGLERVRQIIAGAFMEKLNTLIAKDKALEPEANAIAAVDRLVRLNRDLIKLLNNFVSFHDFYSRKEKAIFQAGTLYLDSRSCELCVRVADMAKHATMAPLSRIYIAYCDCTRKETGEKMTVAAAFTGGDSENLMVGRNGVFYDRHGQDWDATIVKIIENPISIRQAFWAPYKRIARFVEEQVAKRAAAADAAATEKMKSAATAGATAAQTGKVDAKPKIDTGLIAALGVGAAGIGAMLGTIVSAFLALGALMPVGVLAVILLISGPSMIMAWLKLRQRNLGPILDANGWAVNAKARINLPFGASLTSVAKLPEGSRSELADPHAAKSRTWKVWIAIIIWVAVLVLVARVFMWFR